MQETPAKIIEICGCAHEKRNHGVKKMWNGRMDKKCWLCPCEKFVLDNSDGKLPANFPGEKWVDSDAPIVIGKPDR